MLAVVQEEDRVAVDQRVDQPLQPVAQRRARAVEHRALAQAERGQRGGDDLDLGRDRRQLDHPHAAVETVHPARQRLAGEPRLPGAARADERDQPRSREQLVDPLQVRLAADEARHGRTQVARAPDRDLEHGQMAVGQLGRRQRAELLVEADPNVLVGRERIGLAAGGGERGDVAGGELLVERVLGDRGLELRERRVVERQQRAQARVLELGDARRAAPEFERLARASLGDQPFEARGVNSVGATASR